jgi:Fe-S-cluster containining protein
VKENIIDAETRVACDNENSKDRKANQTEHVEMHHPEDIRWRCIRCHACCGDTKQHIRHIRLLETEVQAISMLTALDPKSFCIPANGFEPYKFEMCKQTPGNCIFLEGDSCAIYEERPLTCRFYPFFLEEPSEGTFNFGLTSERCPGLGQGPFLRTGFFRKLLETASKKIRSVRGTCQPF